MTWEFWFIIGVFLILILTGMWFFLGGVKKVNEEKEKVMRKYLFAYRIVGDSKSLPMEFLVNWQISNLENHLYLLYLTLEEDLDMENYLYSVWVDYMGWEIICIDVYMVEGMFERRHRMIGKFDIIEGRMCWCPLV